MDSLIPQPSKLDGKSDLDLNTLFLSPGEDTSTGSSPNSSSQHSGSPCDDWAFPGPVWNPLCDPKSQALDDFNLNLDFDFSSGLSQDQWPSMDMDTDMSSFMPDSNFSIDPSSTPHLGPVFNEPSHEPSLPNNRESMFQFLLSQPPNSALGPTTPLPLHPPNPGSMTSRSTSPTPSKSSEDPNAGVNPNDLSLLTQISQKARATVGVTLAVRAKRDPQGTVGEDQSPMTPVPTSSQPKVPIPRLRPAAIVTQNPSPSTTTTVKQMPSNSQQSLISASSHPEVPALPTLKSSRPKTSHTTIERRYRTNLNARILALRRAVPALRILEKNTPVQTQGKGLTGASAATWDFDDVVNERGYVDGVKAAKKNSKGVVLGKAVEYIKVLKRRETRLRREADGLRELLSGLVGGPELLHEWEREWRERFGGEEADELSADAEENEEGDADGEEGEEGEDCNTDDEDGRAKKRARVEKKERKAQVSPAPQVEKRRRGRPRKTPLSDVSAPLPQPPMQPQEVQAQHQSSKTLLAAFLLLNFFNPNVPISASNQPSGGSVLTPIPDPDTIALHTPGWTVLQGLNMIVSGLLLFSLVGPYLPAKIIRLLPRGLLFGFPAPSAPQKSARDSLNTFPMRSVAISAACASGDERGLRNALGADGNLYSVVRNTGWALLEALKRGLDTPRRASRIPTPQEEITLRGWRHISQLEAIRCVDTSLFRKIQAYFCFSSCLPRSKVSPSDHITLAILAHSFMTSTATELWESARSCEAKTPSEALALDLDIGEAIEALSTSQSKSLSPSGVGWLSPVHQIAAHVVLVRTKALASRQFTSLVSGQRIVDLDKSVGHNDGELKMVVAAGRELGGALGDLTMLLDKVDRYPTAEVLATLPQFGLNNMNDSLTTSDSDSVSTSVEGESDAIHDTHLLLLATLLYRRIFSAQEVMTTHVLSPPPSPTSQSARLHLALRQALASTAFDASPDTEDARDRVVDMLAETRKGRFGK